MGGKIVLLPGMSAAEEFATHAHQVAHELMHRLDRRGSSTKTIRETEAEAVAFVVCSAVNLETASASQDYFGLYHGDTDMLSESLQDIQQAATEILKAIEVEKYRRC